MDERPSFRFCFGVATIMIVLTLIALMLFVFASAGDMDRAAWFSVDVLFPVACGLGGVGLFLFAINWINCRDDRSPVSIEPARPRFRLTHWSWLLLTTVTLVIAGTGLSIWLPWYREQPLIQKIKGWKDSAEVASFVETETAGPDWLRRLVGEDRMHEFKVFDRVYQVELHGPAITDAEIAQLNGLTSLLNLFLGGTGVTDAGLAHLRGLTNLRELSLVDTAVTDAGLAQLAELNLRRLHLEGTSVTDKGVEDLQKAMPDCKISH